MPFQQHPPTLGNQYDDDRVLRSYLSRALPDGVLRDIEGDLRLLGERAGGDLYRLQLADRHNEPVLTQWDAWGNRIDRIEVTRVWHEAERIAAEMGLVAAAYERRHEHFSRIHQFALAHLFTPATDLYSCPLAMTDGAARTLLDAGNTTLIDRAVPHLTSRDPDRFWTSGQWMTELPGGSDVGRTETVARQAGDGTWRLYGCKWFTSAITSQMALALARPEGNPSGSRGLALFYVELRDASGRLQNIRVNRLKDKLGTRKLPTAELTLDGTPATLVAGHDNGVRAIAPMLNVTRTWNAVSAVALMRRGLALARDYAGKREAFGRPLAELPLHADTLAQLQVEYEGAFHLTFRIVELLGLLESDTNESVEHRQAQALQRVLTPIVKLITAKQAVAVISEVLEAFGGAGYVEDTGLPVLLRDVQVLPIWEGTTNVLSLDTLRAVETVGGLGPLRSELERCEEAVREPALRSAVDQARSALDEAGTWLSGARAEGRELLEAGARRLALRLGRIMEVVILARHAQWAIDEEYDARSLAAVRRLVTAGFPALDPRDLNEAFALANDMALPAAGTYLSAR